MAEKKEVNNQQDLDEFFNELFALQLSGNYIFRGISKDVQFSPSLFRSFKEIKRREQPHTDVWQYEEELLKQFGRYSIPYLPANISCLDWVVYAQHFGLPTRLLDWTHNPFIGLFFAVSIEKNPEKDFYHLLCIESQKHIFENSSETGIVNPPRGTFFSVGPKFAYPMLENFLDFIDKIQQQAGYDKKGTQIQNRTESNPDIDIKIYDNNIETKQNDKKKLCFFSVNHSNPRIIAQSGLVQIPLSYGSGPNKGWIKDDIISGCSVIYQIKKDLRMMILEKLDKSKIDTIRLFPDLQNICDHIRRTTRCDHRTENNLQ